MVKFGIDLDGVCFDWQYFVDWHNRIYGTSFTKKEFLSPDFLSKYGISPKAWDRVVSKMYKTVGTRNLPPAQGAVVGVKQLSKIGRTLAITARPPWAHDDTIHWLRANFNRTLYRDFKFTKNRHIISQTEHLPTKLEVCISEGVDYLFEDDINYSLPCAEKDVKVLLFDYQGDKSGLHGNIHPVYSWPEAVAKVRELEGIN